MSVPIKNIVRALPIRYDIATSKVLAHIRKEISIHVNLLSLLKYRTLLSIAEEGRKWFSENC